MSSPNQAEREFAAFLEEKGLKLTPQRFAVLKEVLAIHGHFDADSLFLRLRENNGDISRASVYRVLPLLVECGIVRPTRCGERSSHYEHTYGHEHHDHLICLGCGQIVSFCNDAVESLQREVCREHAFRLVDHKFEIRGYCRSCKPASR